MKKKLLFFSIILLFIVTACSSTTYICYNGKQLEDPSGCPTYPTIKIDEKKAVETSTNYAKGYSTGKDLSYSIVSTYPAAEHWYSDIIFSKKDENVVYEVKIQINGQTGSVTCIQGCQAMGISPPTNS